MKKYKLNFNQTISQIELSGRHFKFSWNKENGMLTRISLFDGINWHDNILAKNMAAGHTIELPLKNIELVDNNEDRAVIKTFHSSGEGYISCLYEIYSRGYVICNIEAELDNIDNLKLGLSLSEDEIFSNKYDVRNIDSTVDERDWLAYIMRFRAMSVNFSFDDRPVTNSIDFAVEIPAGEKVFDKSAKSRFMGWDTPVVADGKYNNRWIMSVSALDNSPSLIRGQRIYTIYGNHDLYPSYDLLDEMAEYGCSIIHYHNWGRYISGEEPASEEKFANIIDYAHKLGIKVILYCQPYLISHKHPDYNKFLGLRTSDITLWDAKQDSQYVFYEPGFDWDCDELCLREEKAYEFMYESVLSVWKKYNTDGLYIDFAWPAQELCYNTKHSHQSGLFNFYDYLRLLREWRQAIGKNQIMIGHGGAFWTGSDFIEAFDACLTGEAQEDFAPDVIGQQFGLVPTLWAMHRKKQDEFRSSKSIEAFIREGMTPHCGLGITGTAIIATLDPAHHPELIALWQMWRAFPVENATFYNYLTRQVVELDNDEIDYSLYVTEQKEVLLLLVNRGGPISKSSCAVGVRAQININELNLPDNMKCWRMKGNNYNTFRIVETESIEKGIVHVAELGIHEFTGFILTPENPPVELVELQKHLTGRWERLAKLMEQKQKRLMQVDDMLDAFAKLPNARSNQNYNDFMQGRGAE